MPRFKTLSYTLGRILPFLSLFIGIETIIRLIFIIREWSSIKSDFLIIPNEILVGLFMDINTFLYLMIPVSLYFLFLSPKRYGTKTDRIISTILFGLMAYAVIFSAVAEWFFWDEFSVRFNFIAVDYLIYTTEVIRSIMESYAVIPLMIGIGIISFTLTAFYYICFKPVQPKTSAKYGRFIPFTVNLVLAIVSFCFVSSHITEIGRNNYLHEIGKNGIYELFSAYRHNELPYKRFYVNQNIQKLMPFLQKNLQADGGKLIDSTITRHIHGSGKEKHYNVVLITVESLSADFMKTFGNTENITPYLDELANNSLFFSNIYATGTRTVYGLSAISLSLPPLPGNSIVRRPENENLFTLGSVFDRKGYVSKFIYGGHGYFDNMNYFFGNNGYDIIDRTDLSDNEVTFSNAWGVADEDVFNRTLKENDQAFALKKPFFDMIMTTSNHRPFTYPEGRIDIPSHTGRSGAVKYTDYAIHKFLKDAESRPWFRDTIFVIIADHTAGSARKSELDPDGYHIPLFIYAPHIIKPRRIDNFASQIDLAPTLLALMNMNYDSRFYGQDILKNPTPRAFISNYQKLGYITPDKLVILEPVKKASSYHKQGDMFIADETHDKPMIIQAISYFQGADNWKIWNRK